MDTNRDKRKLLGYEQLVEEIGRSKTKLYQYGFLISKNKVSYEEKVLSDSVMLDKVLDENKMFITREAKENKPIYW